MSQNSKWLLYVLVLYELLNLLENQGILKKTKMLITLEKKNIFQFLKKIAVS